MIIAVAGMGYVGLSVACLLAQKHEVHAVDIMQKVDQVNAGASPIAAWGRSESFLASGNLDLHGYLSAGRLLSQAELHRDFHPNQFTMMQEIILTPAPLRPLRFAELP